ncbi:MAG: DUF1385 domain-containing protein [Lachnospiraceae bacterium]
MKSSGIGGQAVIEGVMMKNKDKYAVAVRKPDKEIEVVVKECHNLSDKYRILKLPIIRGVFNFIDSLVVGMSTLTYSASFYDDEEEEKDDKGNAKASSKPAKEKTEAQKAREEKIAMTCSVIFAVVMAVLIFMVAPYYVSRLFALFIKNETAIILIEGIVRLAFFIIYVKLISLMSDIKRVFMYHGAEHKCINCVEHGMELTVENVMASSKEHKRCGTSFLLIVMCISIVFFMFIRVDSPILRLVLRLLLIPLIAGVSYEVLKHAGNTDSKFMDIISRPGLMLQHLTTREPDADMVEVAIASVEAVFDWRTYIENLKEEEA